MVLIFTSIVPILGRKLWQLTLHDSNEKGYNILVRLSKPGLHESVID
jgi:hypothetical protein